MACAASNLVPIRKPHLDVSRSFDNALPPQAGPMSRTPKIYLIGVGESDDIQIIESDRTNGRLPVRGPPEADRTIRGSFRIGS